MPQSAEAHSASIDTNRNCTVEISNFTTMFCLNNPKVYMESGFSFSPPQPTVRTTKVEVCSFTKDDHAATGAVGVLTYELFHMSNRRCDNIIAVMFSVPFDTNMYKNWLGVGIFEASRPCDEKLYKMMYYDKDFSNFTRHEADGCGIMFGGRDVDVRATMSDEGRAMIKLEIYNSMGHQ